MTWDQPLGGALGLPQWEMDSLAVLSDWLMDLKKKKKGVSSSEVVMFFYEMGYALEDVKAQDLTKAGCPECQVLHKHTY